MEIPKGKKLKVVYSDSGEDKAAWGIFDESKTDEQFIALNDHGRLIYVCKSRIISVREAV